MKEVLKRRQFVGYTVAVIAATVTLTNSDVLIADSEITIHQINIADFNFVADTLSINVGDKVTWTNMDIVPHTATAKDRSWNTGLIKSGDSATIVVSANMTASYFCEYHPMMTAKLGITE